MSLYTLHINEIDLQRTWIMSKISVYGRPKHIPRKSFPKKSMGYKTRVFHQIFNRRSSTFSLFLYVTFNQISSKTACILSKVCINIEKRVNVIRLYLQVDNPEFIANYVWISTEAGGTCNTLVQKS